MSIITPFFNEYECTVVGAGNYGIVVQNTPTHVTKLFKKYDTITVIDTEVQIQTAVYNLLKQQLPNIKVPAITLYSQDIIHYKNANYLCGIGMEYVQPPKGFHTQVHTILGYHGSDLDTEWGMKTAYPISATNPTRGFFASTYTLEDIWEEEGSDMTVELLAYQMGKAHRLMLENGILPIDLEWIWSRDTLWVIDFGLCEFGYVDPIKFLYSETSYGLQNDLYIPHKGDRGYEEFIGGYSIDIL